MIIGGYKIISVNSGLFSLDGGAMFGIIPRPLWEKTNPPDDKNRVSLAANLLLLEGNNKKILIDTGMGTKWDDKMKDIYGIRQEVFSLESSLQKFNIKTEEITDVLLTHLHFDHAGGSTKVINGIICPTFPNAKYFVQKTNFEWAQNPTERDKGSYLKENFIPLKEAGFLHLVDEDFKFDNVIESLIINGHTFGQQLFKISDGENTLLFCGDLLPFTSHLSLPYIMSYDLQPLVTLNEKKEILRRASDEKWKLYFEHDPYTKCADIKKTGKGFQLNNVYEIDG